MRNLMLSRINNFEEQLEKCFKIHCNDYCNIMKVIIFVTDNLYEDYKEGGILCERLCRIFCLYLKIYMVLRQKLFMKIELEELQVNIIKIFNIKFSQSNIDKRIDKLFVY